MIKKEDTYPIGRITKAHGLKGEVVFNFEDDIFDRVECPYLICEVEGILVPFFMEEYRFKTDSSALVKFEDINSAEQALMDTAFFGSHTDKLIVVALDPGSLCQQAAQCPAAASIASFNGYHMVFHTS